MSDDGRSQIDRVVGPREAPVVSASPAVLVGAVNAGLAGSATGSAVVAMGAALTGALISGFLTAHISTRLERLAKAFEAAYARGATRAELEQRAKDEDTAAAVAAAVRQALDAVDAAVVPTLGVLAARYGNGRRVDAFFRGFARFLGDLTREEFAGFEAILRAASAGLAKEPDAENVRLQWFNGAHEEKLTVDPSEGDENFFPLLSQWQRVFHLLEANYLALPDDDPKNRSYVEVFLDPRDVREMCECVLWTAPTDPDGGE